VVGAVWEAGWGTDRPDRDRHQDLEREELDDGDLALDRHSVMAELDEINSRIVALGYGGGEQGKGTDGEWRSLQDQGSGETSKLQIRENSII
jgi:hypothetical protein